jgi:hypothetical protein
MEWTHERRTIKRVESFPTEWAMSTSQSTIAENRPTPEKLQPQRETAAPLPATLTKSAAA